MQIPHTTYRIQFNSDFTLKDLQSIKPYLVRLGIGAIYASPIFKARPGSTHGYDVIDPLQINPEIGSLEELKTVAAEFRKENIGWVQDIVPNHMAYDSDNIWLSDIFENGNESRFINYFDINWEHHDDFLDQEVMAPFFGQKLEEVIEENQLSIVKRSGGLKLKYYENEYPLSLRSYPVVLDSYDNYRNSKPEDVKAFLKSENGYLDEFLTRLSKDKQKMHEVVTEQHFRPTFWKRTNSLINYRRFFTVNDLICLRMEDETVFNTYHQLIDELLKEDVFTGLRVDHIDGLYEPEVYLERLKNLTGNKPVWVEKILEHGEKMPDFKMEGTTGYDFLAMVNSFLVNKDSEEHFTAFYQNIYPHEDFETLLFHKKKWILNHRMAGELDNLLYLFSKITAVPEEKAREMLQNFACSFGRYRTYIRSLPVEEKDREVLDEAIEVAQEKAPHLKDSYNALCKLWKDDLGKNKKDLILTFFMKLQQITGPLAAKGGEDTAFYVYNRLISRNEVGDNPGVFGLSTRQYHQACAEKKAYMPMALNCTATHDTKRGEDARMRINALSYQPDAWFGFVKKVLETTQKHKKSNIPDLNDTYFIFQVLIGIYPEEGAWTDTYLNRLEAYLIKALREAKRNTNWATPDSEYENETVSFIERILADDDFDNQLKALHQTTAKTAAHLSLTQLALKMLSPGIPDLYRGTELPDYSLVDPDNRRPVDYDYLDQLATENQEFTHSISSLTAQSKFGLTQKLVDLRKKYSLLLTEGSYESLLEEEEGLIAFKRRLGDLSLTCICICNPDRSEAISLNLEKGINWLTENHIPEGRYNLEQLMEGFPVFVKVSE